MEDALKVKAVFRNLIDLRSMLLSPNVQNCSCVPLAPITLHSSSSFLQKKWTFGHKDRHIDSFIKKLFFSYTFIWKANEAIYIYIYINMFFKLWLYQQKLAIIISHDKHYCSLLILASEFHSWMKEYISFIVLLCLLMIRIEKKTKYCLWTVECLFYEGNKEWN